MRNRQIERIPFRSELVKYRNIETRNGIFNKLKNEAKRKEIAYDALKLILNEQIQASWGCYWDDRLCNIKNSCTNSKELQKGLVNLPTGCEVCQRGLMMVSQIRLGNDVDPDGGNVSNGDENNIKGFSIYKFNEMEGEYEHNRYYHPYDQNTNQKLANICCNVIANGNFNRFDKTDYLKQWKLTVN